MVNDFRIMLGCASETPMGLNELTMAVAREFLDTFDIDFVSGLSVAAKRQLMDLKNQNEELRREMQQLRDMIETIKVERNQPTAVPTRRAG